MKILVRVLLGLVGLIALLLVWGVAIEPRFILDQREEVAYVPGLPPAWHGKEVALLADFQIGMWLDNEGMVRKAIREVVARRPAAVLIAGDFIYTPTDEEWTDFIEDYRETEFKGPVEDKIRQVLALLEPLTRSGIPTYAVLGNHDYGMAWDSSVKLAWVAERLTQALQAAGITVLRNQAVAMANPGTGASAPRPASLAASLPLYLGGIGPEYPEEANVDKTLAAIPEGAPRIIMMHNPRTFADIPAGQAPVALAAHTHGGQMRIPGLPQWSWLTFTSKGESHADGWIIGPYGSPRNRLYVNRGIGFSMVPIRINCPPEITYFRLLPATQAPATT